MGMRPQIPVGARESDETLAFIRQTGVEWVSLRLELSELFDEAVTAAKARLGRFGLAVSDAYCMELQKCRSIHLGLSDRDDWIETFNHMLRVLGRGKIPFTSIAWQPHGILRSGWRAGEHTRGGVSMYCDQAEILSRPNAEERTYSEGEIWENFRYFLERVIPAAEETGVRLALHPNDPPLACMAGIPSLIWNSECFRRAIALAGGSPALGIKLCVGCWLESGGVFGNLMADIREFCADDRVLCVHFRNVDRPLPVFEETLAEDGCADMYAVMKELVRAQCQAVISVDHSFQPVEGFGGRTGSIAYPTGFMKGLLWAAETELGVGGFCWKKTS